MKKLNWGWRIAIFYMSFAAFMLFLVGKTLQEKTELVSTDYYAKELAFQDHIDKQERTRQLTEQLDWNVSANKVSLKFPSQFNAQEIKAYVTFYRPSDSSKDITVEVFPDSTGNCTVSSEKLEHGVYTMKIEWSASNNGYYNESTIKIN
jgi:nitrogen fixation protein FixH